MAPSSFASAAAANSNSNSSQSRDGSSEWARRVNGATQTFRRPSGATNHSASNAQQDPAASSNNPPPRYVPPHRNGPVSDMRYTKEQLLDLYKSQQGGQDALPEGLSSLFVGGWQPEGANGSGTSTWGQHGRDAQQGPDICWDHDGAVEPLGLHEMDDEEKELFSTSVNTPLKVVNKDNQQSHGRRVSVSNNANSGAFGLPSPSINRGMGRRREPSESHPYNPLASPGPNRDEPRTSSPPPSLLRRRTDFSRTGDGDENGEDKTSGTPFGTLKRNPTGPLGSGFGAPTSPWASSPGGGIPPMGSFGNFGLGGQQAGSIDKRPGLGSGRAESRFKNLLNKDGDDAGPKAVERQTSQSNLTRANDTGSWRTSDRNALAEAGEDGPAGSAALAADSDMSPPGQRHGRGFGTPSRKATQDEFGFGSLGMTTDNALPFGHGTPTGHKLGLQLGGHEPMSPTDTNPYQSPEQHGVDHSNDDADTDGSDVQNPHLPGLGGFGHDQGASLGGLGGLNFGNLGRGVPGSAGDRSQTSSVGPGRGFGGFGGLGQLGGTPGGWPVSQGGFGTPGRQSAGLVNPFGNGIFGNPMGDLQSPGLAGLGGNVMGPPGSGLGGSRMASMFPPAMQDQMRQGEQRSGEHDGESAQDAGDDTNGQQTDASGAVQSSASNQPPAPQQRTMVMPDRMRWIYRDPQGQTQGPWSGLEMHDWYKAGFFSPELLVKKYEDPDYEPLAQLIRRIGNSREPFLVPQIGIPHGQPSNSGPTAWAGAGPMVGAAASAGPSATPGGAQPPFASSFPSFGTTLTADQQNALERRKQEEQYLMARQKEHLAQAQIAQRMQGHIGGGLMPGQLHHHSSAHSLHSQPSFGSITNPNNYQPSPIQGPASAGPQNPGFFDNSFRGPQAGGLGAVGAGVDSLGHIREEEIPGIMDRLNLGGRGGQAQFGAPGQPLAQQANRDGQSQQVQQMLQDRARLQQEQAQHDAAQQQTEDPSNERLQEFQKLQSQEPSSEVDARFQPAMEKQVEEPAAPAAKRPQESLSLTEQVQKAASAKESPAAAPAVGLPQPFPPAPSQSPLPAPAAQRTGRQTVADQLQTDSRDLSQPPSTETPSAAIAPWAKEPAEAPKGPSLKEIQEMEAQKAAEAEELASAARRAAFQREMEAQAQSAVVQPGLPASASWATAGSPAASSNATTPAAWAKSTQKAAAPAPAKSMAQIQKEEEARKRKLAAAAAAANAQSAALSAVTSPTGGKSYANLAGKITSAVPTGPGGAWTTVGAGGKTKTPGAPATATTPTRVVSSGVVPTVATVPSIASPTPALAAKKPPTRTVSSMAAPTIAPPAVNSAAVNAQEELRKWGVAELRADLNKGISVDEFVAGLFFLPLDAEMITEAVHGVSSTLDSRHFALEFIRRKRLADKGQVDPRAAPPKRSGASPLNNTAAAAGNAGAGWSEVAKKGPAKEVPVKEDVTAGGSFKVVPAKKKGKR